MDFLIERNDGAVLGVEDKAGAAAADDFKCLKWLGENLAPKSYTEDEEIKPEDDTPHS